MDFCKVIKPGSVDLSAGKMEAYEIPSQRTSKPAFACTTDDLAEFTPFALSSALKKLLQKLDPGRGKDRVVLPVSEGARREDLVANQLSAEGCSLGRCGVWGACCQETWYQGAVYARRPWFMVPCGGGHSKTASENADGLQNTVH